MAKSEAKTANPEAKSEAKAADGRGKKVVLPDGTPRVEFIRRRFYDEGAKRGDIARELTELQGQKVAYQIVFAATKTAEKPVPAPKAVAEKTATAAA